MQTIAINKKTFIIGAVISLLTIMFSFAFTPSVSAATVKQVSTGYNTACAVADGKVKCWGSNSNGQVGSGTGNANHPTPIAVVTNKNPIPAGPTVCKQSVPIFGCISSGPSTPAVPASALAGKYVEKVSVGRTHACALSNARVYCWGDGSRGQLGANSSASSGAPVSVAINGAIPAGPTVCKVSVPIFGCISSGPSTPAVPASALRGKEVVDIAAGDFFTCALASDGTVACWGEGANGRLGTNSTDSTTYPKSVYVQAAIAAVPAKPGVCVQKFGNACLRYNPAPQPAVPAVPATALWNKKAVALSRVSGASMCVVAVDKSQQITSRTGYPYCWGYGMGDGTIPSARTTSSTSQVTSCSPGTSTTVDYAYFDAVKPVRYSSAKTFGNIDTDNYTTGLGTDQRVYTWGMNGYKETKVSKTTCSDGSGGNGLDSSGNKCGGGSNHGSPGCASKETKKTITTYTYTRVGQSSASGPLYNSGTGSINQKQLTTVSGDAAGGLFCASTATSGTWCDANGTSMNEGQTGSGYTQHCTTTGSWIFTQTTCDPAPTTPQQVVASGWLAGKTVSSLDTGGSGFTCALANGTVGCWGKNDAGQLGVGDTTNRKVPAATINL